MTNTDVGGGSGAERQGGAKAGGDSASPKEMATAAVQTVKQEVASFASSAQDKVGDQIEQKKQTASKTMGDFANAIRKAGDELSQHDQSVAGRMVKQAADGLESFSRSVQDKRPEELVDAVRDFGRRNPVAFIGGSVLLGLALGRFLRSSEQNAGQEEGQGLRQGSGGQDSSYRSPGEFASGGASGSGYEAGSNGSGRSGGDDLIEADGSTAESKDAGKGSAATLREDLSRADTDTSAGAREAGDVGELYRPRFNPGV